jgi:hypothetical protein
MASAQVIVFGVKAHAATLIRWSTPVSFSPRNTPDTASDEEVAQDAVVAHDGLAFIDNGWMLYDKARIFVAAGAGGDGCLSFRREAHVPHGGPDGGDGGYGGSVVVECDPALRDLQSFRRRQNYRARRGGHGAAALRHGASGEELVVRVPPGTQLRTAQGDLHDLVRPGQRVIVARGGSGGRGTSTSRRRPAKRRACASVGCPARRPGSTSSSSCLRTSV